MLLSSGRQCEREAREKSLTVVDESIDNVYDEDDLAIELLQADVKRDLAGIFGSGNSGGSGDLYPYRNKRRIGKTTKPAIKLLDGSWTGITLHVKGKLGDDEGGGCYAGLRHDVAPYFTGPSAA